MLKVDQFCALRFITVIKAYDCNSSNSKREGPWFLTSQLGGFEWSVVSKTNLYCCKSCKFHDLASGFRAQPGSKKFESQNLKKIKVSRSYFIFVTYLPLKLIGEIEGLTLHQGFQFFWLALPSEAPTLPLQICKLIILQHKSQCTH